MQRRTTDIKLTESEVKVRVLAYLKRALPLSSQITIANEFKVGSRRIDLALLGERFVGVEIKTEFDSLRRLSAQTDTYLRYFDRLYLVIATVHVEKVLPIIDPRVDVLTIMSDGSISVVQEAKIPNLVENRRFLDLLTLRNLQRFVGYSVSRIEALDLIHDPRQVFYNFFAKRYKKTSKRFWQSLNEKRASPKQLLLLSRYAAHRRALSEAQRKNELFWIRWNLQMVALLKDSNHANHHPCHKASGEDQSKFVDVNVY